MRARMPVNEKSFEAGEPAVWRILVSMPARREKECLTRKSWQLLGAREEFACMCEMYFVISLEVLKFKTQKNCKIKRKPFLNTLMHYIIEFRLKALYNRISF